MDNRSDRFWIEAQITCHNAFEVDTNANLILNTAGCKDWLTGGTNTGFNTDVVAKNDTQSGSTDESFGNGTKEDTSEAFTATVDDDTTN
jgi:hypothetical protein